MKSGSKKWCISIFKNFKWTFCLWLTKGGKGTLSYKRSWWGRHFEASEQIVESRGDLGRWQVEGMGGVRWRWEPKEQFSAEHIFYRPDYQELMINLHFVITDKGDWQSKLSGATATDSKGWWLRYLGHERSWILNLCSGRTDPVICFYLFFYFLSLYVQSICVSLN